MALKHLDSLLNIAVPSREEAVALGGVDVGEQGRHRVVIHAGVGALQSRVVRLEVLYKNLTM